MLYTRDVVLSIDNILKPRRRYLSEDPHRIALKQQHKAFTMVHRILRRSKRRQARYANRRAVDVDLKVGDPVYYKNNQRQTKLQAKWKPFYRISEQTSPVTFKIKNQLDGKVTKAHKELLRFAKIDEWDIPKDDVGRPLRKATYVMPQDSESDNGDADIDNDTNDESNAMKPSSDVKSDAVSVRSDKDSLRVNESFDEEFSAESDGDDDNMPLAQLARKYRKERDNSSSKGDIPLFELKKRLRIQDKNDKTSDDNIESDIDDMSLIDINECRAKPTKYKNPMSRINNMKSFMRLALKLF